MVKKIFFNAIGIKSEQVPLELQQRLFMTLVRTIECTTTTMPMKDNKNTVINFLQNMNEFVCDVMRSGLLIMCATLCLCIWEHCIIL